MPSSPSPSSSRSRRPSHSTTTHPTATSPQWLDGFLEHFDTAQQSLMDRFDAFASENATFRAETLPNTYTRRSELDEILRALKELITRMDVRVSALEEWRLKMADTNAASREQLRAEQTSRQEWASALKYAAAAIAGALLSAVLNGHLLLR